VEKIDVEEFEEMFGGAREDVPFPAE